MYQIGDQVVYGIHGVCNVVDEEKLLSNEISIVMGLSPEESRTYLKTRLKNE